MFHCPHFGKRPGRLVWPALALLYACDGDTVGLDDRRCISGMLYQVRGDDFTFLSGGRQTLASAGQSSSHAGTGWNPEIEPRAKCRLSVHGYSGRAELLWNDVVVERAPLSKATLVDEDLVVLDYVDPDGTRVEYHVYSDDCEGEGFPPAVATRTQVEALEAL